MAQTLAPLLSTLLSVARPTPPNLVGVQKLKVGTYKAHNSTFSLIFLSTNYSVGKKLFPSSYANFHKMQHSPVSTLHILYIMLTCT
jgi:hypothetical protein